MKKLLLLLPALCFALPGIAQQVSLIPRVGLNLANTYPDSYANMRPGINAGIGGEVRFSSLFALESGVYYSEQGNKKGNMKLKYDYLNVPVLAKFYLYKGFHLFAGPQWGINLKAEVENAPMGGSFDPKECYSGSLKSETYDFDFSLSMGAGYAFDCGLLVSANYNAGCTYIGRWRDSTAHNGVIQLNVGWLLKL